MIETFSPHGTNDALYVCSLPRRARRGQHFVDAHVSHVCSEVIAENHIAVPQQVARDLIKRKGFPQLLSRPLSRWVRGNIEVKDAATIMGQYQEYVKDLETDRRDSEEIDGDHLRDVVLEECPPSLRGRFATAYHVLADTGLADIDTQFEKFAVNARCAPTGILPAHPAD